MPNFIVANWIILSVRISNRGFNNNVSTKTHNIPPESGVTGRRMWRRRRVWCGDWWDVFGTLSTDGDAADAGGLDARHGAALRTRLRAGAWQAQGLHGRALAGRLLASDEVHWSERTRRVTERTTRHLKRDWARGERRAAGGSARAHQVYGYDREAGPRAAHKSNFAHSHALHGPPSSIFHIRGGAYFHNHNASYS